MATITPKSRQAWRAWLDQNHDSKAEAWVVFYKRHTGRPTLSYDDAVEEALCFGWIDGVRRSLDSERYTHRFSPRTPSSRWSALNRTRAERMERAGKMTAAGRQKIEEAMRNGKWNEPAPEIDLSVPPELAARLQRNKKAADFFDSLSPSYRKQFCAWINAAKRDDTRTRRLDESIRLLARGEKLGMR
jgi:uncharacterized protein YdeI (YjbR/CyaY-like superfamily)